MGLLVTAVIRGDVFSSEQLSATQSEGAHTQIYTDYKGLKLASAQQPTGRQKNHLGYESLNVER